MGRPPNRTLCLPATKILWASSVMALRCTKRTLDPQCRPASQKQLTGPPLERRANYFYLREEGGAQIAERRAPPWPDVGGRCFRTVKDPG